MHTPLLFLSQYFPQNNSFPPGTLLAPFPLPGTGSGQSRPPIASAFGTGRPSSPGPLSIAAANRVLEQPCPGSITRAAPAPLSPRRSPASGRSQARPALQLAGRRRWQPARRHRPGHRRRLPRAGLDSAPRHRHRCPQRPARPHTGKEDANARSGAGGQRRRAWGWTLPCRNRRLPEPLPEPSAAARCARAGSSGGRSPPGRPHANGGQRSSSALGATHSRAWNSPWGAGPPLAGETRVCRARHCVYSETWAGSVS